MSQPEISVIIPVYNVERYLSACVESVLRQSFQDFEIILVDDESPDACPAMCDAFAASDSRIKVVHKKNGGLGFARNSGLDVASGRYVTFLDSDDIIDRETLGFCHEIAERESADEVRFLYQRFRDENQIVPESLDRQCSVTVADGDNKAEPLLDVVSPLLTVPTLKATATASSCTALYRREVIERHHIRFHSERELISEDYIFNIEFAFACRKIVYTDRKFYAYRVNPSSLTSAVRSDRVEKAIYFSKYLAGLMKSYSYPDADIYAMGFTIGTMRAQNRTVFLSSLPRSEKRKFFCEVADNEYVREIARLYPSECLPLMQKIAFRLHIRKRFLLSWLITKLREVWKD